MGLIARVQEGGSFVHVYVENEYAEWSLSASRSLLEMIKSMTKAQDISEKPVSDVKEKFEKKKKVKENKMKSINRIYIHTYA